MTLVTDQDITLLAKARSAMLEKANAAREPGGMAVDPAEADIAGSDLDRLVSMGLLRKTPFGLYTTTSAGLVRLSQRGLQS